MPAFLSPVAGNSYDYQELDYSVAPYHYVYDQIGFRAPFAHGFSE